MIYAFIFSVFLIISTFIYNEDPAMDGLYFGRSKDESNISVFLTLNFINLYYLSVCCKYTTVFMAD